MVLDQRADQGMTDFVVSDQTLAAAVGQGATFHAGNDAVNGIIDFAETNGLLAATGGEDRGLIHQVGQVCTGEAWGAAGNAFERELLLKLLVAAVHFKNREATFDIRRINGDLTVEATRTHQSGVQDIRSVGRGNDDDAAVSFETIHLGEQLVQGLLPFVVAATDAGTTLATDSVDLVNEDQAGAVLLGLLEQIADPACTDTHEHLNEFRTREGEEGNASLTGNGLGKQGFAGARRADQQQTAGDLSTNGREAFGLLEEGHHFLKLLLGLSNAGDVIEHHAGFRFHHEAGLALAELHGLAGTTGHAAVAARQEDQRTDQQEREQQVAKKTKGGGSRPWGMDVEADPFLFQGVDQLGCQTGKIHPQTLDAVVQVGIHRFDHGIAATVVDVHRGDATGFHVVEEAAVAHACHRCIARSHRGASGVLIVQTTVTDHLPTDQEHDADGQKPEGDEAPTLIHDPEK